MINYALDTNIVSYILRKDAVITGRLIIEKQQGNLVEIPPIVYYEIKRGLIYSNATAKLKAFEKMYSVTKLGIIDNEILDIAISVYTNLQKKGKLIEDADILIAAHCIKHNLTLVTNNIKHFEDIENLQTVNWQLRDEPGGEPAGETP
jgi:predicted nucleic acid-binding protein